MIRVLAVDGDAAVRAALRSVVASQAGLVPVATAADEAELWAALERVHPHVVILDCELPGSTALLLCRRIKQRAPAVRVLIFTACVEPSLTVPALVAQADGILDKKAAAHVLLAAIYAVAHGDRYLPEISRHLLYDASSRLSPDERPVLAMLADGASAGDIARALQLDAAEVERRIRRIIGRLRPAVPASGA